MKQVAFRIILLIFLSFFAQQSQAVQIKAYVSAFTVTGPQNKDEMKTALQTLLMSRLSGDSILVVDTPAAAEVVVYGSYLLIGKVFSIDTVAKGNSGGVLARAFVQGEGEEELISGMGKVAKMLSDEMLKSYKQSQVIAPPSAAAAIPVVAVVVKPSSEIVKKEAPAQPAAVSEIIRAQSSIDRANASYWVSQRIKGPKTGIALGKTLENGDQEVFVAGGRTLQYYRKGKDLQLLSEITLGSSDSIISVDTADLDNDGTPEIYLSVINNSRPVSQVWTINNNALKKVAGDLPYFVRGIAFDGKTKKIYAQEINLDGDYYGNVHELVRAGDKYVIKNPIKIPKFANLYNFSRFADAQGKSFFAVLHPDGYLLVCSAEGEELWRSSDKFGGSETYYLRLPKQGLSPLMSNKVFLDQRIIVNKNGEVIVPQNAGFFVLGDSRDYSKNSVYAFAWNGATLEERWHTKQSQNYLADFAFDESTKSLVLLEVVQKEGLIATGASAVSVKKVE